jgi:hypothetical protein
MSLIGIRSNDDALVNKFALAILSAGCTMDAANDYDPT